MNPLSEFTQNLTRRHFFQQGSHARGLGGAGIAAGQRGRRRQTARRSSRAKSLQHFAGKAKHVIYLHMVGGPSQMDLFDYKPVMQEWYDKDLPDSIRMGQRLTTMTSGQARFPDRPVEIQVRPARQVRHVGQRAVAVEGQNGR